MNTASGRRTLIEATALSDGVIIDGMMTRTCEATGEEGVLDYPPSDYPLAIPF